MEKMTKKYCVFCEISQSRLVGSALGNHRHGAFSIAPFLQ